MRNVWSWRKATGSFGELAVFVKLSDFLWSFKTCELLLKVFGI